MALDPIRPPCSSTNFLASVSPSPVPSCLRASSRPTWRNSSKMAAWSSGAIPIPVSLTAMVTTSSAAVAVRPTRPPSGVNFTALERRFSRICLTFRSSATMSPTRSSTVWVSVIPCRVARSRTRVRALSRAVGRWNRPSSSSSRPASTLDRSRMSLIRERRCRPEDRMSWRYSACFSFTSPNIRSASTSEKPRIAFSGRPQLVGHVGEELRLVAAGRLELPTLVRDLAEEAGVLDGQRGLGGEGLQELDDLRREGARRLLADREPADQLVFAQHRDGEQGAGPRAEEDVAEGPVIGVRRRDVGNLDRLARHRHAALDALTFAGRRAPGQGHHLLVKVVGGAEVEGFGRLVVLEDGAGVSPGQLAGSRHDGLEHRVQIEGRAERPAHVAQGRELVDRPPQLGRPRLQLLKEANILDGDDPLVGEGRHELDLLVA